MGLTASLRDRARVVRDVRHGPRTEGRTASAPVRHEWFACRVILGAGREVEHHGGKRIVQAAQLVARGVEDLRSSDIIEMASGERWHVAGAVETLQARSATPVVTCAVERVIEPPIASVA